MRDSGPASSSATDGSAALNRAALVADLGSFWPLWLLIAASIALRLYRLGELPGLIGDEAWYGVQAQRLASGTGGELRTPTGNVPGLFQLGSAILLHSVGPPSALLLRIPALLSSLAAMALAYAIGRRFFGPTAGMAALVIMACLPANLAYARLGWDPSHAALFILAATYAALARRRLLAMLLFALAMANHPAAVFVAPFLALVYGGAVFAIAPRRTAALELGRFALLLAVAIVLITLLSPSASNYIAPAQIAARLVDPSQWISFAAGFLRLVAGDTTSIFIAGRALGPASTISHAAVAFGLVGFAIAAAVTLVRRPDPLAAAICLGWCASVILLFLVAGSWAMRPGLERFAIPLLPLTALSAAVVVQRLGHRTIEQTVLAVIGIAGLVGFTFSILQPLVRGDSRRADAVWIGLPALNEQALRLVARSAPRGKVVVVAEDWWIYWPLVYLARTDRFAILSSDSGTSPNENAFWITYRGGEMDRVLASTGYWLAGTVISPDGTEALRIWRSPD
ncbi:glycosyltransferase family 39 protein [Sphingomonas edaphi]|uniref:Glycosyltransferase RgtA/B/C/D-like domain-containing protein n=1 Tax=Sphingomonas edaphi TaxID=2315689 RepID=A0A418Q389_9SPHN|nr:glycosyltransferase family 39 protein [Sphingomonas edaphi]RIX32375.1 hypothetical protein D3M59_05360 [Sphingomonas edaphi]